MLTLNDGRSELWQWDTGRKLTVDADCTQVHFSNKFFGRSVDVDVVDGVAIIPDVLLQTDKDLFAWAFVGTPENGYTKISNAFKVNKRNKPADYVFTPLEQTTLGEIMERLDLIEESQDPDAIKNAIDDYLASNPIQVKETDPTVPDWAKQPTKPEYTVQEVGAVATVNGIAPDENGNVQIPVSGGNVDLTGYATEQWVKDQNYLTEVPEDYAKAVGDALNGKLSKSGGTMTGKIVFPTADQNVGFANSEDMKIFGYGTFNGAMHMRMGDTAYPFQIRGNGDRPKYNNGVIALMGDIPTDNHINSLINTALGVIENGTY